MRRARQVDRTPRVSAKINDQIVAHEVRLVGTEGEQLGVTSADDAREYAYARDLDLVEVAAAADPPVCRVMDYGKWRYEEERKARASRRNQVHVSFKEVRLRPKIGQHDYEWKRDRAARVPPAALEGQARRSLPRARARASGPRARAARAHGRRRQGGRARRRRSRLRGAQHDDGARAEGPQP